jgi:peptidoglycan-associated lipoprotein
MQRTRLALTASLLALLLTACAGQREGAEPEPEDQVAGQEDSGERITDDKAKAAGTDEEGDATAKGAQPETGVRSQNLRRDAIDQDKGPLSKRVVYFAFDSSNIQSEYTELLQAHGEYLGANPDVTVTVAGHTDERGSREYNLALGERRARSVKQVLTLNGAANDQVKTISYGEEKPAVQGHDKQAWAKNRRAKLNYSR